SALNPHSQEFTAQVNALGAVARRTFERTSGTSSRFMEQSLREAQNSGSAQEEVSKSLSELRTTMEDLAPQDETFADKALSFLPGRNRVKRYFRGFESNQKQLDEVLAALGRGQEMLQRDNAELAVELRSLWEDLTSQQMASYLLLLLDEQAVRRAEGVERAQTTTVTALRTAVITAQALENQKIVLDQIDAINRTTDSLIDRTSQMLADNTQKIQEQASSSGVSPETLQRAFDNLF